MNEVQKPKLLTVIHVLVLLIGFSVVFWFARSIYQLWQRGDIVKERQAQLRALEAEQIELKNTLSYALRPEFIEAEARNKLNMVKPGETLIVLPVDQTPGEASQASVIHLDKRISNVQKWWRFFLRGEFGG